MSQFEQTNIGKVISDFGTMAATIVTITLEKYFQQENDKFNFKQTRHR